MTKKSTYKGGNIAYTMTVIIAFMGVAGEALFRWLLPEYRPEFYLQVPMLFLVYAWVLRGLIAFWGKKVESGTMLMPKAMLYFMAFKMAKMFVSVVVIFCYVKIVGTTKLSFMLTFLVYYIVFQVLEGLALSSFKQRYKPIADNTITDN
jgi:hypothetical protein